jgi:acyl-CoA thioesterase FadM
VCNTLRPTELGELERSCAVRVADGRIRVIVERDWIVLGEDRLGYAGIVQLLECVRELHWRRDIVSFSDGDQVDTITRSLSIDFLKPLIAGADVVGSYRMSWLRRRSYGLRLLLESHDEGATLVAAAMTCVFYDSAIHRSIDCPQHLRDRLHRLSSLESSDH